MIRATWKDGRVVLDEPAEWAEGARLVIQRDPTQDEAPEDPEAIDPEAIEQWLRWYDSLEPLIFTPEEEADLAEWRQKVKQISTERMSEGVEDLFP